MTIKWQQQYTAIILGWIYQILLSEVLGIPSTIEGGTKEGVKSDEDDSRFSFYDKKSRYVYPLVTYNINSLIEADKQNGDCAKSTTSKDCAHIIPSIYEGARQDVAKFQGEFKSKRVKVCLKYKIAVLSVCNCSNFSLILYFTISYIYIHISIMIVIERYGTSFTWS